MRLPKKRKEYEDYEFIEVMKRRNWYMINQTAITGYGFFVYIYDNGFFEKKELKTPEEKEAYARKIGAFL